MKHRIYSWAVVAGIMVLSACSIENGLQPDKDSVPAIIKIGTRSGDVALDDEIKSLRIIAFGPGGMVAGTTFYTTDPGAEIQVINHEMGSGVYDFVFIANENNGSPLPALAGYYGAKTDLSSISLPASLFSSESADASPAIPMWAEENNVTVLGGTGGVKINNAPVVSIWPVSMKKLGVRIDMVLKAKANLSSLFTGVTFSNLPSGVPLAGVYSGSLSGQRTHSTIAQAHNYSVYTPTAQDILDGYVWGIKMERIILPSHSFLPKNNTSKALKMQVLLGNGAGDPSTTIGLNETTDYTLPPDTRFSGVGTVSSLLAVYIAASPWTETQIFGSIIGGRNLSVSAVDKVLIDSEVERIYFSSNQPSVYLDPQGLNGSGSTVAASSILSSTSVVYNYNSSTRVGMGYIDLQSSNTGNNDIYKVYLNAGGLRRDITLVRVKTNNPPAPPVMPNDIYNYVGTFHRWNETAERLISLPGTGGVPVVMQGAWIAVVTAGREWIRLDSEMSGFNSGYIRADAGIVASGNATASVPIRFRIGLTDRHPLGIDADLSGNAAPRYGKVEVFYGANRSYKHTIYVRQGEAADYMMRPTDDGMARTYAQKISPYNLTDPSKGAGGTSENIHNTLASTNRDPYTHFTQYPSQIGYFFRWVDNTARRAYNPLNPGANTNMSPYSTMTIGPWNASYAVMHESCPNGFRRMNDASGAGTTGTQPNAYYNVSGTTAYSEMRQSLWLNPTAGVDVNASGGSNNMDNAVFGYLADGYFDRQTIGASATGAVNTRVGANADVAYVGMLFYNPNTHASVFFPVGGYRRSNEDDGQGLMAGRLLNAGEVSGYWSTTRLTTALSNAGNVKSLFMLLAKGQAGMMQNYASFGFSIRCVRN